MACPDSHEAWALALLALCWATTLTASTQLTMVGPMAVGAVGGSKGMCTASVGAFLLGAALVSLPSGALFIRFGRKPVFLLGCGCQIAAGLIGLAAIAGQSVAGVLLGQFVAGLSQGVGQFYRFAATEVCAPAHKPLAVSLVLSGGVLAAFAGPTVGLETTHMPGWPMCSGSFAAVVLIGVLNLLLTAAVPFRSGPSTQSGAMDIKAYPLLDGRGLTATTPAPPPPRSMGTLLRASGTAVSVAAVSHTSMTVLMSSLAVAMEAAHDSERAGAVAFDVHFLCMFAPGFVTGTLVERGGTRAVAACGVALFVVGAAVLAAGHTPANFTAGMGLCGVAWNLSFSAGTIQLTLQTPHHEATAVQGANDFVIFLAAGLGAYPLSGGLFEACGWRGVVVASAVLVCGLVPVLAVDAWREMERDRNLQ